MTLTHKWLPVIDEDRCSGCGLCVTACGPSCLGMDSALAVLTLPDVCGSEEHCIGVCADDAIQMAWLPWVGDTTRGKWRTVRGGGRGYQNGGPPFANLSPRLSLVSDYLRTVLAVKGSLRRAQQRRALDGSGPFRTTHSEKRERLTPNCSPGREPLRRHFGTLFRRHRQRTAPVRDASH
jgi:NAD-dependent dihydropyrimidine dehydrogenase PreA subunit